MTSAEFALWIALNTEPDLPPPNVSLPHPYFGWLQDKRRFALSHHSEQLTYFENLARQSSYQILVKELPSGNWFASWTNSREENLVRRICSEEYEARFHAAARAIHALGMITEQQLREIEELI